MELENIIKDKVIQNIEVENETKRINLDGPQYREEISQRKTL